MSCSLSSTAPVRSILGAKSPRLSCNGGRPHHFSSSWRPAAVYYNGAITPSVIGMPRFPSRRNPTQLYTANTTISIEPSIETIRHKSEMGIFDLTSSSLLLVDLDPETAKLGISILGPILSAFAFLFIVRIIMSWYPKLPVNEFPYVIAYAPTEPFLAVTRKIITPLGGVDVTPVVWFGLVTFLNEILLGPQGLLVLVSQQQ